MGMAVPPWFRRRGGAVEQQQFYQIMNYTIPQLPVGQGASMRGNAAENSHFFRLLTWVHQFRVVMSNLWVGRKVS